ncbi:MAG: prolipoprotein diacylglyceryl transferase [Elusimicrobia bacterium]|nr:prolipoprotein diacylglyceryl transferase [Elusimicrobiota bacterium]
MRHPLPWSYPLIMAASLAVGAVLGRREQRNLGLTRFQKAALSFGAFCGAMIGAKLVFLLVDPRASRDFLALFGGGKTILGGILGGYFGVELAKWTLELKLKTGDSYVVPVAASVAVGRLGCFVGGCCFGVPTTLPWGVNFGDGVPRHPTQLYEAAFHAGMALLLSKFRAEGRYPRQLMKIYILSYLVYRFLTEFIRPEPRMLDGLTGYQLLALAMIPLFVYLWKRDVPEPAYG